jgi:hypothetical protein
MLELPVPPIVTDEGGDIGVYPSVASACLELEPIDVLDGAYEAFDSRGFRLRIDAARDVVSMVLDSESAADPAELERRLRRFIERVGATRVGLVDRDRATLPVLLDALLKFFQH